jgi:hypothetical protein
VNELFYKAYDRSVVLSSPALTNEKTIAANEKFTRARDRASRWKFMVGDLVLGPVRSDTTKLSLRYIYISFQVTIDIAGPAQS